MPSLIDIRRRIRSVKNTQQITRAMKLVSAAKLRRAQERVLAARPYAILLRQMLSNVAAAALSDERVASNPLLAQREEKRIAVLLVTSDKGLAGAFNTNLIKAAGAFAEGHPGAQVEFYLIGRKGRDFYKKRGAVVVHEHIGATDVTVARGLVENLVRRFSEEEIDAVYAVFPEFKSVASQKVTVECVLPVTLPAAGTPTDYIFEQSPAEMLGKLLPKYIESEVLRSLLETTASEHAARMVAMEAATTNAGEMIDRLTLFMNRVRQASITREIIEIVSGAAAAE